MATLAKDLPPGVTWSVPYDTTPFHHRLDPTWSARCRGDRAGVRGDADLPAEPAGHDHSDAGDSGCAAGTFIGLSALHYTLNQLTLFGMVLAIGIVVDDAIVVIENVERIMTEEHLEPRAATRKAMGQITGAIIAITVVLSAVFIPSALQPGATGIIYAQFALTIAVSMGFSAFLALSFTPALCAAILKPDARGEEERVVFRWFDKGFDWVTKTYIGHVGGA
jgi:multidrug efflux pump